MKRILISLAILTVLLSSCGSSLPNKNLKDDKVIEKETAITNELKTTDNKVLFVKYTKKEFNAPMTYTKEDAAKEGITEGYYAPLKTKETT